MNTSDKFRKKASCFQTLLRPGVEFYLAHSQSLKKLVQYELNECMVCMNFLLQANIYFPNGHYLIKLIKWIFFFQYNNEVHIFPFLHIELHWIQINKNEWFSGRCFLKCKLDIFLVFGRNLSNINLKCILEVCIINILKRTNNWILFVFSLIKIQSYNGNIKIINCSELALIFIED